jgi:DNA-directed RNA polymerase subunit RPC12/RpoP
MRDYITSIVYNIVKSVFNDPIKSQVISHTDRIQFRCPYCMEGRTPHKKRGNLYFNRLFYICFRCGKKTTVDRFCKDFNQQIDPDKKMEIVKHLDANITYKDYQDDVFDADFDDLLSIELLDTVFNSGDLIITDFTPIQRNSIVYKYLLARGINESLHINLYQAKYWYSDTRYENVICFLNKNKEKVLGMQIRNLKEGKKRMFKIYNYESLYKLIHSVDDIDSLSINQVILYNKLSYYFNILNVEFTYPITIFEGYIDSLFYPNALGVVGVNTDFSFLEKNNLDIRYFFDNDEAGFDKSSEKIKEGYPVFLWRKLFDFIVSSKKTEDPYKLMDRISKIKDLNKLASIIEKPYSKLGLENFFSEDVLDLKYIPKKKKYYKKLINN